MKELLEIILDRLKQVPGVVDAAMFNSQPSRPRTANDVYPALFLQLSGPISYQDNLDDTSYGTATLRIHVVNESPNQGEDFDIYELKDLVHRYLHRYTTGGFTPLSRTGEQLNSNHNNLYDYTIDYVTSFHELTEPVEAVQEWLVEEMDVEFDMNQDGDEIIIEEIN